MRSYNLPQWLQLEQDRARQQAVAAGYPTKRHEAWRYSPTDKWLDAFKGQTWPEVDALQDSFQLPEELRQLVTGTDAYLVFYNCQFLSAQSKSSLDDQFLAAPLSRVLMSSGRVQDIAKSYLLRKPNPALMAMGWANQSEFKQGAYLQVHSSQKVVILHVYGNQLSVDKQQRFSCQPRNVVHVCSGANTEVVEAHLALNSIEFLINNATDIWLDANAKATFGQVLWLGEEATVVSDLQANLAEDAQLSLVQYICPSQLTRNEVSVDLTARGASVQAYTLTESYGKSHVDNSTYIHHVKGHTTSEQVVKQMVFDQARAVFSGRLLIEQDAQKSNASQINHNLLMSDEAEADSKPQLEVNADDVKAAHGATVGRLQDEELFYLMSRGLSREKATELLTNGFKLDLTARMPAGLVTNVLNNFIQKAKS